MSENKFETLNDLYEYILPALRTKKREMVGQKFSFISEDDIWNYLCNNIWIDKNNLTIADIVNDILNTDSLEIYKGRYKNE